MNIGTLLQNFFNAINTVFTRLFGTLTNLFHGIANGFSTALNLAARGLGAFTGALSAAARGALQFAQAALSLRAHTGLSYGQAAYVQARGSAFGMSSGDTNSIFGSNPMMGMFGMGNRIADPHFFSKLAGQYSGFLSQGPLGAMMGQGMMRMQFGGQQVPDSVLNVASMNPKAVRQQEDWFNGLWQKLGVGSKAIQQLAEAVPLLSNRLTTLLQVGFLKLTAAIGPSLVSGLEKITTFFTRNAERIAPVAERIVTALSNVLVRGLEVALNFLEAHADTITSFISRAFDWMIRELPPLLMRAGAAILRAFSVVLEGFSNGAAALVGLLPTISTFFSTLTQNFVTNLPTMLQSLQDAYNGFRTFLLDVVSTVQTLVGQARQMLGLNNNGSGNGPNGGQPGQPHGLIPRALNALGRGVRNISRYVGFETGDPNDGSLLQNLLSTATGVLAAPHLLRGASWLASRLGIGGAASAAGSAGGAAWTGLASALGGAVAAGSAIGVAGYEGLRRFGNWTGFGPIQGLPSTAQIARHYLFGVDNNPLTQSPSVSPGTGANASVRGAGGYTGFAGQLDRIMPTMNVANNPAIQSMLANMATAGNGHMQGLLNSLQRNLPSLSVGALNLSRSALDGANALDRSANDFPRMIGLLENIADSNKGIQRNTNDGKVTQQQFMNALGVLARAMADISQDETLGILSSSGSANSY